jgi:hypothetical protein
VAKIVTAIKASRSWQFGRNAIVLVWDENDYGDVANKVMMLVDTNYSQNGQQDPTYYDHFSLLRTLEAGFRSSLSQSRLRFHVARDGPNVWRRRATDAIAAGRDGRILQMLSLVWVETLPVAN